MNQREAVTSVLSGVVAVAAVVIVVTSGESVAVRFLTVLVSLDVAFRLWLFGRRRPSDRASDR